MLRLLGKSCLSRNKCKDVTRCLSTTPPTALVQLWHSLSASTPVLYLQEGLIQMHDISSIPWCGTIVLSTLCLRSLITLPLTIYQQKISVRLELLTAEMRQLQSDLKYEVARAKKKFDWTDEQAKRMYLKSLQQQWSNLIVRDNCLPLKLFIVLFAQIPLWICQSMALRNLVYMLPDPLAIQAQIAYQELTIGGFAWIPNLTEVDSSFILPIALGLINLTNIEVQSVLRAHLPQNRFQKYATRGFHLLNLIMVPVACTVPSALCLYWTTSSAYGLAQNMLLVSPAVRRAFGIKHTNQELAYPYKTLAKSLRSRFASDQSKTEK